MDNQPKDFSYNQEINLIYNQLQALGITADISCRVKDPSSILYKLARKSLNLKEITDIVGFRIIVNEQDECYKTLKLIQEIYNVLPEKCKDYIDKPKTNGYRSLHTVILLGSYELAVEIQIRSREMHDIAENGQAAHSRYKNNREQSTFASKELNLLMKAYAILDQAHLTESALFAYLQKITDYLERNFAELQKKINSDYCYESL